MPSIARKKKWEVWCSLCGDVFARLVRLSLHDSFHVSWPAVLTGYQSAGWLGQSLGDDGLLNLLRHTAVDGMRRPPCQNAHKMAHHCSCALTLSFRALSFSQVVRGSNSFSRLSLFSLAFSLSSNLIPSLATFWKRFPSNSGSAWMQYSSTGSVK